MTIRARDWISLAGLVVSVVGFSVVIRELIRIARVSEGGHVSHRVSLEEAASLSGRSSSLAHERARSADAGIIAAQGGHRVTAQSRLGDQVACGHVQAISVRLFAMSHKPRIRLPKTIAWSVWLSIQARILARNAWLCAGLNTA